MSKFSSAAPVTSTRISTVSDESRFFRRHDNLTLNGLLARHRHHNEGMDRTKDIVMKSDLPCIIVLAGGEGRRIGGQKPDTLLQGRPLIDHILHRLAAQGRVAISGDSQLAARLSLPFIADEGEHGGPLSGILSGLHWAEMQGMSEIISVPCDAPFAPFDLVEQLGAASATLAIARSGGRLHPTFGRWSTTLISALAAFHQHQGQRKMLDFIRQQPFEAVDWSSEPFDPLFNINTPFDLGIAEIIASTGAAPVHLDLEGLKCPMPALKTAKALDQLKTGENLLVSATDPLAGLDIPHLIHAG
eukprot:gene9506-9586_t